MSLYRKDASTGTVPDTVVEIIIFNVQRKKSLPNDKKGQKAVQSVYKVLRRAPKCITIQQTTIPYHKVRQSTPPFYKVPACTTKNYTYSYHGVHVACGIAEYYRVYCV